MKLAPCAFVLLLAQCADSPAVRGRAVIVAWRDAHVIEMCDTHRRWQLGVSTSNAVPGLSEVSEWVSSDASTNVIVQFDGARSTLPSGWAPAPGVEGVVSIGSIHPVARGACPVP